MKYGDLNLGQVEAIVNKLGGIEGVRRFLSGELVVKEPEWEGEIWRSIKIGTGLKTANDFIQTIVSSGLETADASIQALDKSFKIGCWAEKMLKTLAFTDSVAFKKTEMELVNISVADLDFKESESVSGSDIYKRAYQLGLELCPAEVGPQLWLQYKDQPKDDHLHIGMKPILGRIFRIDNLGYCRTLNSVGEFNTFRWASYNRWVFLRRKPC